MSDTPTVSVIMANYRGEQHLAEAIESVQRQTLTDWELLMVDDASTDRSVEVAQPYAAADPRIRVFVQPANRGPGAARNVALEAARGRWVAIFDSDDVMLPQRLERMVARAEAEGARIVADNQLICDAELGSPQAFLPPAVTQSLSWVDLATLVDSSRLYSSLPDLGFLKPLIARDAIEGLGLRYDEGLRIGEDFQLLLRLLAGGLKMRIEPEALYLYRKHGASISHRLSRATLSAMLAADAGFRSQAGVLDPAVAAAFRRRERGLHSWLAYDALIEAAKGRRPLAALGAALSRPHAWPLMMRPVAVRWRRLWNRTA